MRTLFVNNDHVEDVCYTPDGIFHWTSYLTNEDLIDTIMHVHHDPHYAMWSVVFSWLANAHGSSRLTHVVSVLIFPATRWHIRTRPFLAEYTLQSHTCKLRTWQIRTSHFKEQAYYWDLEDYESRVKQMGTSVKSSFVGPGPHLMGKITCVCPHFARFANTHMYTHKHTHTHTHPQVIYNSYLYWGEASSV